MKEAMRWNKRGSAYTLPEIEMFLSSVNRESETLGLLGIDNHAVPDYVCTVDILHTIFNLQSSVQYKHLLSALASQYFPLAGASHSVKCNKKAQSCRTPGLCLFSEKRKDREVNDGSPKGGVYPTRLRVQRYNRIKKVVIPIKGN